jgi:hypothetical protein
MMGQTLQEKNDRFTQEAMHVTALAKKNNMHW